MNPVRKVSRRLRREKRLFPFISQGYSRKMASSWIKKERSDFRKYGRIYDENTIKAVHKRGYLCKNIKKYGLLDTKQDTYITDFNYIFLYPYNNSFSKWLGDVMTTNRVLKDYKENFADIYFSIIIRDDKHLIFKVGNENRQYVEEDVLLFVREKRSIELRPAYWVSRKKSFIIEYFEGTYYVNKKPASELEIKELINSLPIEYVITDSINMKHYFGEIGEIEFQLKFWLANDAGACPEILFSEAYICGSENGKRKGAIAPFDKDKGTFVYGDKTVLVGDWSKIKEEILSMCQSVTQINYFTTNICLKNEGGFIYRRFSTDPKLPMLPFEGRLNDYLKEKAKSKKEKYHISIAERYNKIKKSRYIKRVNKTKRKGMRPYMQKLWDNAVKNDLLHTKGVSLPKKIWAWKHGFQSFRIEQYGLTKTNYKDFLSDYDYYWLNRINNMYQIWINDKTTFRCTMEPFKGYVPKYYFSIFKREGETIVSKMWDCPNEAGFGIDGIFDMLEKDRILAFKPSAETHGDGFCCLAYDGEKYFSNGKEMTKEAVIDMINNFHSFYVVTEYIQMHDFLKKIYPKSVNTVRIMVINKNGYEPKIMQTYMRIGSSRTGYTDNVGYGGICAMIDAESGELYQPETLIEHKFYPQPEHPDTGTPIAGKLPNWDLVTKKVLDICRYMPELEYLGFDIAITNDGFRVIEINIHQDLHKVATYSDEIKDFFNKKMQCKRKMWYNDLENEINDAL